MSDVLGEIYPQAWTTQVSDIDENGGVVTREGQSSPETTTFRDSFCHRAAMFFEGVDWRLVRS